MEVILNPDGTRDRSYRPYIEEEELGNSVYLYSPNGPGYNYGLYDSAQPSCGTWYNEYQTWPSRTPARYIDSNGYSKYVNEPQQRKTCYNDRGLICSSKIISHKSSCSPCSR